MLARLAKGAGLPMIHVVRREDQALLLRSLGADIVLNSEDKDFDSALRRECARLKASIAFDAVAGAMTGRLLAALPARARVVVYGLLSEQSCRGVSPGDLIFREKSVSGFYLGTWLPEQSLFRRAQLARQVQNAVRSGVLASDVQGRYSLEDAAQGLLAYHHDMSKGKILICPWLR
jgi:NADPH:quinone reductase-like Zn-dependent oxidoreductase